MAAPTVEAAFAMGMAGSPAVEAERIAFESWLSGHCWGLGAATWDGAGYKSPSETGGYLCPAAAHVRGMWAAWRDRAALCN